MSEFGFYYELRRAWCGLPTEGTLFSVLRYVEMTQIKKNRHRNASWERRSCSTHMLNRREGKMSRDIVFHVTTVLIFEHGVKMCLTRV